MVEDWEKFIFIYIYLFWINFRLFSFCCCLQSSGESLTYKTDGWIIFIVIKVEIIDDEKEENGTIKDEEEQYINNAE
jgi:hypothetical protein